jgi:sterol desaturase/sphingolipid hydroxylase (fatty acid hydroxylase superfamily)
VAAPIRIYRLAIPNSTKRSAVMPSPLELMLDPVSLAVLALYGALIAWEALAPARSLPAVRGWKLMGLSAFAVYFFVSSYLPLLWTEQLARFQIFDLTGLGTWGGAVVGILLVEFGIYVWHRTMHNSNALWRLFHQMHHSAERVDTYGAFWFSPLDMVGWTVIGSLALTLVVGVTAEATTVVLLATTLLAVFQHANIRTPQWLGYVVQRPESHSHHHERGVHARNYSDLPVFDLLFGTFHNPKGFAAEAGFYDGASARVLEMLVARDVSKPDAASPAIARA